MLVVKRRSIWRMSTQIQTWKKVGWSSNILRGICTCWITEDKRKRCRMIHVKIKSKIGLEGAVTTSRTMRIRLTSTTTADLKKRKANAIPTTSRSKNGGKRRQAISWSTSLKDLSKLNHFNQNRSKMDLWTCKTSNLKWGIKVSQTTEITVVSVKVKTSFPADNLEIWVASNSKICLKKTPSAELGLP